MNDLTALMLEPLSEATGKMLHAVSIRSDEYLQLSLDADTNKFRIRAVTLRIDNDCTSLVVERVNVRGVPHVVWGSPCSHDAIRFKDRLPTADNTVRDGWFSADATDTTALVIHHVWPKEQLVFTDEMTELTYRTLALGFFAQMSRTKSVAKWMQQGELPSLPSDFITHPDYPAMPQQQVGIHFSLFNPSCALWLDQGLGKTFIVVNRVNYEGNRKRPDGLYRVLVVCPSSLRTNWQNEFTRFSVHSGKIGVLRGGEINRAHSLMDAVKDDDKSCRWSVSVCSVDSVESMLPYLKRVPWDLIVLDESHYIKSPSSKRSRALRDLTGSSSAAVMSLTGTPVANTPMDLWAQFEFMCRGGSGFNTFKKYREFYGVWRRIDVGGTAIERLVAMQNLGLLQERIARFAFVCTKHDAKINLPEKVFDVYECEMSPVQKKAYGEMVTFLRTAVTDQDSSSTEHVLTQLLRLSQITSGFIRTDIIEDEDGVVSGGEVRRIGETSPKVESVIEMIRASAESDPDEKTIVFHHFNWTGDEIERRLKEEGIGYVRYNGKDRDAKVLSYNDDPNTRVFLGNPGSCAEGLNLLGYDYWNLEPKRTDHTGHIIIVDKDWSSLKRRQSIDRAHRRGTRSTLRITDLHVPGTIDEDIYTRVMAKIEAADGVQDIEALLSRVLGLESVYE